MDRFKDQVAVITGGAAGIGLATARRLGQEGGRDVVGQIGPFHGGKMQTGRWIVNPSQSLLVRPGGIP
jgi:hypothetical protein